jgi:hypothetical protein
MAKYAKEAKDANPECMVKRRCPAARLRYIVQGLKEHWRKIISLEQLEFVIATDLSPNLSFSSL